MYVAVDPNNSNRALYPVKKVVLNSMHSARDALNFNCIVGVPDELRRSFRRS